MNLLNYKKIIINKSYIFLIIIFTMTSCIEEKDYRNQKNLDLLMGKTIKYADSFNNKKGENDKSLLGLNFKINKTKKKKNTSEIYYEISIPHNLREEDLNLFMEEFVEKFRKKYKTIIVDIKHIGIEKISGVVAKYTAKVRDASIKLDTSFVDFISKEKLKQRGIKHYILEHDFSILVYVSKEMDNNKNLSINSAIIKVAKNQKISVPRIKEILSFAKKYYQKDRGENEK